MANSTKNNRHSATIKEVLLAVNSLAGENEKQFKGVYEAIGKNEKKIQEVSDGLNSLAGENEKQFDEILAVVNDFAGQVDGRFAKIEGTMATKMATKQDLANLESKMVNLESKMVNLESNMVTVDKMDLMESRLAAKFVTKSYLDDKLADQTSEIFLRLDRRQNKDRSFKENLVGVISGHSLITPKESNKLKELI